MQKAQERKAKWLQLLCNIRWALLHMDTVPRDVKYYFPAVISREWKESVFFCHRGNCRRLVRIVLLSSTRMNVCSGNELRTHRGNFKVSVRFDRVGYCKCVCGWDREVKCCAPISPGWIEWYCRLRVYDCGLNSSAQEIAADTFWSCHISGYGPQMFQRQHLEMQLSILALKSCHWSGKAGQIDWWVLFVGLSVILILCVPRAWWSLFRFSICTLEAARCCIGIIWVEIIHYAYSRIFYDITFTSSCASLMLENVQRGTHFWFVWQLLLGTAERNIRVWNVESKRVECDLTTEAMFPRSV